MIDKILLGSASLNDAKRALDAGTLRQRVLSENVANATTPGFRARQVAFEELLREAGRSPRLDQTHPGHMRGTSGSEIPAQLQPRPEIRFREGNVPAGENNVEIERELIELRQNALHYQALSQFVANRYRGISTAIRNDR